MHTARGTAGRGQPTLCGLGRPPPAPPRNHVPSQQGCRCLDPPWSRVSAPNVGCTEPRCVQAKPQFRSAGLNFRKEASRSALRRPSPFARCRHHEPGLRAAAVHGPAPVRCAPLPGPSLPALLRRRGRLSLYPRPGAALPVGAALGPGDCFGALPGSSAHGRERIPETSVVQKSDLSKPGDCPAGGTICTGACGSDRLPGAGEDKGGSERTVSS